VKTMGANSTDGPGSSKLREDPNRGQLDGTSVDDGLERHPSGERKAWVNLIVVFGCG
jgi:hypothetical protein